MGVVVICAGPFVMYLSQHASFLMIKITYSKVEVDTRELEAT